MNKEHKEIAKILKNPYLILHNTSYIKNTSRQIAERLADLFEREEKEYKMICCNGCDSKILTDRNTIYPIDCDCGHSIEGFNRKTFLKMCGV